MGHVLMENRKGIAVDATLTHATGTAAREAALAMLDSSSLQSRIQYQWVHVVRQSDSTIEALH